MSNYHGLTLQTSVAMHKHHFFRIYLQLEDGLGGLQLRIHSLGVQNGGQRHEASLDVHQLLQHIQTHPEVVRVEELVQVDVLEAVRVLLGALGGFPENELTVGGALAEVSALLVSLSALAALHQERSVGRGKVGQQVYCKMIDITCWSKLKIVRLDF